MTALRVMFVVPHPIEGPSTRFRVAQFLPDLARHGIEAEVRPLFSSAEAQVIYGPGRTASKVVLTLKAALRRLGDVGRAGRFDLVYILREAFPFGPPLIERLLHARAGRMVFDFDDAIWTPSAAYRNPLDRLRDFGKPAALCRRADGVVPGARLLADFARAAGADPDRIRILPTVVDTDTFRPDPAARSPDRLTLGWIGTPRGSSYLHLLAPALTTLAGARPDLRVVFVGAEPFALPGVHVEFRDWSLAREIADIQSFDIGLMPLPDDEEARGKCGFKIIEYMACGAAVIASPVGANRDIVHDGHTGLLASTPEEWLRCLQRLAGDTALRHRLVAAARTEAVATYSRASVAPRLVDVILAAAAGQRVAPREAVA